MTSNWNHGEPFPPRPQRSPVPVGPGAQAPDRGGCAGHRSAHGRAGPTAADRPGRRRRTVPDRLWQARPAQVRPTVAMSTTSKRRSVPRSVRSRAPAPSHRRDAPRRPRGAPSRPPTRALPRRSGCDRWGVVIGGARVGLSGTLIGVVSEPLLQFSTYSAPSRSRSTARTSCGSAPTKASISSLRELPMSWRERAFLRRGADGHPDGVRAPSSEHDLAPRTRAGLGSCRT
jgi:hypothetical protein